MPLAFGVFFCYQTHHMNLQDHISLPRGFRAAGVAAGIKKSGKKDLAILISDKPAVAAGLFTTNQVKAAPVRLDQARVRRGAAQAIVVNSGNANACTGAQGMKDAKRMAAVVADALALDERDVLVCSTGVIGKPMPMQEVEQGIRAAALALHGDTGNDAAESIMTTDTRPKRATVQFKVGGKQVTLTAFAKGAGMIQPNMATMLCFMLTDAAIGKSALKAALREAVAESFNCITVDGDMSTNDTILALANGAAGHAPLRRGGPGWKTFVAALKAVSLDLALKIARDGEGATKLVTVRVLGARSDREANLAGRAIANSMLVKTSWNGDYPNWGRIMDALGYSPARIREDRVEIRYDDLVAVRGGLGTDAPIAKLSAVQRKERFTLTVDLHLGRGRATVYTCDCSEEYVRINVDYVNLTTGKGPT